MTVRRRVVAVVVLLGVVAACTGGGGGGSGGGSGSAEDRYGRGFGRDGSIKYADDVVLIDEGPRAVKEANTDGLHFTLTKSAGEKAEVGKVLLVSGRVAGRVLAKENVGGDVRVALGPVELTDIIEDGELRYDGDVDPRTLGFRAAPQLPSDVPIKLLPEEGTASSDAIPTEPSDSSSSETSRGIVSLPPVQPIAAMLPTQSGGLAGGAQGLPDFGSQFFTPVGGFLATSIKGSDDIGLHLTYDQNGMRMALQFDLRIAAPKVHFYAKIGGKQLLEAEARLDGAAGLHFQFDAATTNGKDGNIHREIPIPADVSVPIGGPVPVSLLIRQMFVVSTAFSAKEGKIKGEGDYALSGSIGMRFSNGGFSVVAPGQMSVKQSMLQSMAGVSVGVTGIVLAYKVRVMLGIGAFGLAAGPFAQISASIGATRGSDLAGNLPRCYGVTLSVGIGGGIGYQIPVAITKAINSILGLFNSKYSVQPQGGPQFIAPVLTRSAVDPNVKLCTSGNGASGSGGGSGAAG